MKIIAVIENGKLLQKHVSDEEYVRIMSERDPDGKYWIRQMCRMP